jgi:hypothetical protein
MPKPTSEYTLADWRRLRPLTHAYKSWRYRRVNQAYLKCLARVGDPAAIARAVAGRDVLVTVAFNDPQAIRWQAQLLRHYVPRALYLIVDNSSDEAAAAEIAAIAARSEALYLWLPKNPWRGFSRSHGIALNWVWANVLRPGAPRAFGFIDDDLFPTAPDDPFAPLDAQNFFGMVRQAGPRWFLWAGYCMFRYDAVKDKPLDFGQDWFIGLDTGGANWNVLYRHCDRGALKEAPTSFKPYKDGVDFNDGPMQWCGTWLHEIGSVGDAELAADKRRVVAEILSPHLSAAGALAAEDVPSAG